jgi:hypothetical protein
LAIFYPLYNAYDGGGGGPESREKCRVNDWPVIMGREMGGRGGGGGGSLIIG